MSDDYAVDLYEKVKSIKNIFNTKKERVARRPVVPLSLLSRTSYLNTLRTSRFDNKDPGITKINEKNNRRLKKTYIYSETDLSSDSESLHVSDLESSDDEISKKSRKNRSRRAKFSYKKYNHLKSYYPHYFEYKRRSVRNKEAYSSIGMKIFRESSSYDDECSDYSDNDNKAIALRLSSSSSSGDEMDPRFTEIKRRKAISKVIDYTSSSEDDYPIVGLYTHKGKKIVKYNQKYLSLDSSSDDATPSRFKRKIFEYEKVKTPGNYKKALAASDLGSQAHSSSGLSVCSAQVFEVSRVEENMDDGLDIDDITNEIYQPRSYYASSVNLSGLSILGPSSPSKHDSLVPSQQSLIEFERELIPSPRSKQNPLNDTELNELYTSGNTSIININSAPSSSSDDYLRAYEAPQPDELQLDNDIIKRFPKVLESSDEDTDDSAHNIRKKRNKKSNNESSSTTGSGSHNLNHINLDDTESDVFHDCNKGNSDLSRAPLDSSMNNLIEDSKNINDDTTGEFNITENDVNDDTLASESENQYIVLNAFACSDSSNDYNDQEKGINSSLTDFLNQSKDSHLNEQSSSKQRLLSPLNANNESEASIQFTRKRKSSIDSIPDSLANLRDEVSADAFNAISGTESYADYSANIDYKVIDKIHFEGDSEINRVIPEIDSEKYDKSEVGKFVYKTGQYSDDNEKFLYETKG